jgi:hypothetical protein
MVVFAENLGRIEPVAGVEILGEAGWVLSARYSMPKRFASAWHKKSKETGNRKRGLKYHIV